MVAGLSTAERITEAALRLFATGGLAGTPMELVRLEAGVSNGSLYHHFPSRAVLAARLLNEGMDRSQRVVLDVVASTDDAEPAVRGVVTAQLGWVEAHPEWARLLFGDLPDEVLLAAEPTFSAQNRQYVAVIDGWWRGQVARGAVRDLPFEVAHALWLGPGQELARHWVRGRGRGRRRPTEVAGLVAEGAWQALVAR